MNEKIEEIKTKIEEIKNKIKRVEKLDKCLDYDCFLDEGVKKIVEIEKNIMNLKKKIKRLAQRHSILCFEINKSCQEDEKCLEYIDKEKDSMKLIFPETLDPIDDETILFFIPQVKVLSWRNNFTAAGEERIISLVLGNGQQIRYRNQINYNYKKKGLGAYLERI